jgi:transcriptional regulator with XRE-family HTH domain
MSALEERLAEVMQAMNWSHADLMRVTGQSSSVVSQWLGKGSKPIKSIGKIEAAEAIERESGFSALWVARNIGPKRRGVAHTVSDLRPIVTTQKVTWEELVAADLSGKFEIALRDDALAPDYPAGTTIRFDGARQARPGWPVMVKDSAGAFYVRDYIEGSAGRWTAAPRQRGYASLDSVSDGLQLVGVMYGADWA